MASGREAEFFNVFDDELGGGRPPPLLEVAGPQARMRRAAEKTEDFVHLVQIFDAPVPQVVDQPMDVLTRLDIPVPEQVIEVPTISCSSRIVSYVNVIEQTVDIPVPGRLCGVLQGFSPRQWFLTACCGTERRHSCSQSSSPSRTAYCGAER